MSVRWPDVDHPRTPSGWSLPANLLVAQGPASWPRGRRPANEAEEILSEAVAWWDVARSGFRDGDRWLRNLGQGGSALDLRLGSSLLANSNDPKWLGPEDVGYVYLPGVASNRLSVPSEAALDITGDLSVTSIVACDSWRPAADQTMIAKDHQSTIRSWYLNLLSGGLLQFVWWDSGGTVRVTTSNSAVSASDGEVRGVRASLDVDDGSGGHSVTFYTSSDGGASWVQLGTPRSAGAFTTSVRVTTTTVQVGGAGPTGTSTMLAGRVYRAGVYSDTTLTTTVLDVDCDAITSGSATSFTATTGQTVTINRSTSGRKSVVMPARRNGGRACMLLGTDDYLEVVDGQQHRALNFFASNAFTVAVVIRSWGNPSGIFHMFIAKGDSTNTGFPGYYLFRGNGTAATRIQINDNAISIGGAQTQNLTNGTLSLVAGVRNTFTRQFGVSINGAAISPITDTTTTGMVNNSRLRIGNRSSGNDYADMEFMAAAVWRRALTTREITVLNTAAPWGT